MSAGKVTNKKRGSVPRRQPGKTKEERKDRQQKREVIHTKTVVNNLAKVIDHFQEQADLLVSENENLKKQIAILEGRIETLEEINGLRVSKPARKRNG